MSDGIITTDIMREDERGAVAVVTVDRAAKLNVMTGAMCRDLAAAVDALAARDDVRVVVLRGAGERALIGGADVAEMVALGPETARAFITDLHRVCGALRALPVRLLLPARSQSSTTSANNERPTRSERLTQTLRRLGCSPCARVSSTYFSRDLVVSRRS